MYSSRFSALFCNDRLGMGCRICNWAFIPFFVLFAMFFNLVLLCFILFFLKHLFLALSFCTLLRYKTVLWQIDNG